MNKEISLNDLASALAEKTGSDVKKCIDFIKLVGRDVLEELNKYNSASIPNIGTFEKQTETSSDNEADNKNAKVIFMPDERLKNKLGSSKGTASAKASKPSKKQTAFKTFSAARAGYNNTVVVLIAIAAILLTVIGLLFINEFSSQTQTPAETSSISTTVKPDTESQSNQIAVQPGAKESNATESGDTAEEVPATETAAEQTPAGQNEVTATENYSSTYTVEQDEWLWIISKEVYSASYLWPLIFEANKSADEDPDMILPGQQFSIPVLEGTAGNLTDNDRQRLKTAYLTVVEAYENAGKTAKANDYRNRAATF